MSKIATTNKIPYDGLQFFGNRALGVTENPVDTTDGDLAWRNGTVALADADLKTDFEADGTGDHKTIQSATYDPNTRQITVTTFLATTDGNTPGSITKVGLSNDSSVGTGRLVSEHKFDAITKNTSKELYFTITIQLTDNS